MKKSTLFLVLVFIVLVIGTWLIQKNKATKLVETTPTVGFGMLINLEQEQIRAYRIESLDGKRVDVSKNTEGVWVVEGDIDQTADETTVDTSITQLNSIGILDSLDPAPDLSEVGLQNPVYTITVFQQNGDQSVVYIGNLTPTSSGYYAIQEGDQRVLVVNKYNLETFIRYLDNPPLPATPTPTLVIETIEPTLTPQP